MIAKPTALPTDDLFQMEISRLPRQPTFIFYEDDYCEVKRSLRTEDCDDEILLHLNGDSEKFSLASFRPRFRPLARSFILHLVQTKAAGTAISYGHSLKSVDQETLEELCMAEPRHVKSVWTQLVAKHPSERFIGLKALLTYLCDISFGAWSPLDRDFVVKALSRAPQDTYAAVRSGEAFLTLQEETALVRWFDEVAVRANSLERAELQRACLLVCSYQFGMRPKQLGMLRKRDCTLRQSPEDGSQIVHLAFRMIKQRDAALSSMSLNRKVKREWAPLFASLLRHIDVESGDAFVFGFDGNRALKAALKASLAEIFKHGGCGAVGIRHSLAQRLVDSGADKEELAAAMGHSSLQTGLVYYRASPNQAELVNKALGLSETYQAVAKMAELRFISPEDLSELKGEQQVAGVPHGLPIAGIGGCTTGQPACPYNPVTSCYGCGKFMPVRDVELHEQVLRDFRDVVHLFRDAGRGEDSSPAFLQLQRTISEVQAVVRDLRSNDDGK